MMEKQPPRVPPITKSDSEFSELGVEFVETTKGVSTMELNELFLKVRSGGAAREGAKETGREGQTGRRGRQGGHGVRETRRQGEGDR